MSLIKIYLKYPKCCW